MPLWAAEPRPTPAELSAQAARCRRILETSIIKFYLPNCVDQTHGGYLESLRDGKFAPSSEKFLTMQGRQLWFFSTLAHENIDKEAALAAAKTGFETAVPVGTGSDYFAVQALNGAGAVLATSKAVRPTG